MRQTYIIQDDKVMSEGAELDVDEVRAFWRTYGMRRLLARRPSTSLWILNKHAKCDFLAVGRDACKTACVGPGELPTLNCY
jgi:hypothetical protein